MIDRVILSIACLVLAMPVQARELDSIMHELGEKMSILLPELYSDDSSVEKLQHDIVILADLLDEAEEHINKSDPGRQVTYSMLRDQLRQASEFSKNANLDMLRADLSETYSLCASCHNQDRKFVVNYGVSKFRDMDEFLAAEYSYITRDYEAALTSYGNSLEQGPGPERTQKALDRMLVITLEVSADPKLALQTLLLARKKLVANNQDTRNLDEWLSVLKRISAESNSAQSPLALGSIEEIDNYLRNEWPIMQVRLNHNEQLVHWIAIRGRLHRMLALFPDSTEIPRVLYWLALSDRALHYRFYDSLSRRYLVRCIEAYSSHPVARECFKEYEMLMLVSFSGSGGVYLPIEAQQEISALRRLVYQQ